MQWLAFIGSWQARRANAPAAFSPVQGWPGKPWDGIGRLIFALASTSPDGIGRDATLALLADAAVAAAGAVFSSIRLFGFHQAEASSRAACVRVSKKNYII